jgi:hypothetical protein
MKPHELNQSWNSIQSGMGRNPDQVKADSQELLNNETKSASNVVKLLLMKLTTYNPGQDIQQ